MNEALFLVICSITGTIARLNNSGLHLNDVPKNGTSLNLATSNLNNSIISRDLSNHSTNSALETLPPVQVIQKENKKPQLRDVVNVKHEDRTERIHILKKIHRTLTRSKDAVWATISLTFICVLLVLAVAQSQMWKNYHGPESQGVPLPNFNERVLFKDVMEHKVKSLKEIFQKRKKKDASELESLLTSNEYDDESVSIPVT